MNLELFQNKNINLKKSKRQSFSHVQLFATAWTVAQQAPLSMGFSRQEYWSGLPFPSPKTLKDGRKVRETNIEAGLLWHEPHNVDSIMASDLDYYRILRLHGFVHSTLPSAVDTLSFQCRDLEKKGFSRQSKSSLSVLIVIQGFTTSGNPLIYYFFIIKTNWCSQWILFCFF